MTSGVVSRAGAALRGALDRPAALSAVGVFALSGAAWLALIAAAGGGRLELEALAALCVGVGDTVWTGRTFLLAVAMWSLMSVAMMLPTAAPTIGLFADMMGRELSGRALAGRVALFCLGYAIVWGAASVALAGLQAALSTIADPGLRVDAVGPFAGGAALIVAGLYQRSALKAACLAQCRNPMAFFFGHWREGRRGAVAMGVRHGAICVGCCWGLMLIMFVVGVMNLIWMAALGLLMLLEKTAPNADRAGRWLGLVLIAAGVFAIAAAAI